MYSVGTVGCGHALETVALHDAGKSLALASSSDVDQFTCLEQLGTELLANLVLRGVIDAEFNKLDSGLDSSRCELPGLGLGEFASITMPVRHLQGAVSVTFLGAQLHHTGWRYAQHGDGHDVIVGVPDLGHAQLLSYDCFLRHGGFVLWRGRSATSL
ncbi:unannotated protein [freshwater metagenome]|uniref:Unannotated protein n=1 Tax=freshwater metagenome TaxID=449393 RepID=A0A6J7A4T9_9ZZZZ